MAESVVLPVAVAVGQVIASSLLDPLMQKALDVVKEEKELSTGLEDEISHLNLKLGLIRGVLEDAEAKQLKNASVKGWLVELKEIMYDAEDLLDGYATDVALEAVEAEADHRSSGNRGIMSRCFTCYGRPDADEPGHHRRVAVAREIKAINERLDKIVDARNGLGLRELSSSSVGSKSTIWQSPETTSILEIDESGVLGRSAEKDRIMKWLLADDDAVESESNKKLFVLPIVGMGGLGKTTLARFVFNHADVKSRFELRMWVCVSNNDFDVKRLTKEIVESIYASQGRNEACNHTTLEALQSVLVKLIEGKRFLLVLDDAWGDDQILWVDLLKPLRVGGIGSRIIVTTRNKSVADAITGRMEPVFLTGLAREDLLKLFRTCAFGNCDSSDHAHLERIGEQIVGRLKGSPLAAKTIGRLLNTNLNAKHWRKILESEFWKLEQVKHEIMPSLMLSYQYLPANLKQCFTYLSLFPKDFKFNKDEIVRLWVAHDFIQNENRKILEEKGRTCLDYLLSMSLLQQDEHDQQYFSMHDLVHDLSESTSKDEYLRINDDKAKELPDSRIRHVSFFVKSLKQQLMLKDIDKYDKLRSLMIKGDMFYLFRDPWIDISSILHNWFERLRCLRVLTLQHCPIKSLLDSIGNMKHLRFLDIRGTDIEILPNSFCSLHNLQVLDASFCDRLHELPNNITRLVNLRYLGVRSDLISRISGLGKLTALQKLNHFCVENRCGRQIGELKHLNMLHGSLDIRNLENVENGVKAKEALLDQNEFLQKLILSWKRTEMNAGRDELDVLEGLQPSVYMKELFIRNYSGAKLAAWVNNDSLPDLETIHLYGCRELESIPSLPHLREMRISECPKLSEIGPLPLSLQVFELDDVGLASLPEFVLGTDELRSQATPLLSDVSIRSCPKLLSLNPMLVQRSGLSSSLKSLCIGECNSLDESLGMHIQCLTSLETLGIGDYRYDLEGLSKVSSLGMLKLVRCEQPLVLDLGVFVTLRSLAVTECPNVTLAAALPPAEPCTSSLTDLELRNCPNIKHLSADLLRHLTALWRLIISSCQGLTSLEFQAMPSLRTVFIESCPNLSFSQSTPSLYAPLRDVTITNCSMHQITGILARSHTPSLNSLKIRHCDELVYFGGELESAFLGLTSLENLHISSCKNLKALPSDLRGFTSLYSLMISECPQMQSLPEMGLPASIKELYV